MQIYIHFYVLILAPLHLGKWWLPESQYSILGNLLFLELYLLDHWCTSLYLNQKALSVREIVDMKNQIEEVAEERNQN